MATSAPTTAPTQQTKQEWDESQCIAALAQLERLQAQIDDLRLTIPRVVAPLGPQVTKRPELFAAFKKAAVGSQTNIKTFRTNWQSEEIQSIFEHTKASFEANSDLSASSGVPRYGWEAKEAKQNQAKSQQQTNGAKESEKEVGLSKEERAKVVEEFRNANRQITVWTKEDNRDILVQFVAESLKMRFHVVVGTSANGGDKLDVECLGTSEPFISITRSILLRPRANELKYLLDMIAAYKTVPATSCAKCNRLLDKAALTPTARRSRQKEGPDGTNETIWEALHESCLDLD